MQNDISKKTVAVVLLCAILISVFCTFIVLNKEPVLRIDRHSTVAQQGAVGFTIVEGPEQSGTIGFTIIDPNKDK